MATGTIIEVTDEAITKILEKQRKEKFSGIRLGITGGGCAGFEYVFDRTNSAPSQKDVELDYGKFRILIDKMSVPYLVGMTLDFQKEGLNELFKFINPRLFKSLVLFKLFVFEKINLLTNKIEKNFIFH